MFRVGSPLSKKRMTVLTPAPRKVPLWHVEHGVEVAGLQQVFAQAYGRIVGIAQKGVFDNDGGAASCFQVADKVL
jgi:hypothetical protein